MQCIEYLHAHGWPDTNGPHTQSTKLAQQCDVQQETVSICDTISMRKLHCLGKCHNKNMSKAACSAIILAYVTEEETVYRYRKRKRSIWTKEIPTRIFYLQLYVTFWKEDANSMRINDELLMWYNSQPCTYILQTVAQPACCATKFQPVWKLSNCCTVKPYHTQSNNMCNSLCYANCLTVCRALRIASFFTTEWNMQNEF